MKTNKIISFINQITTLQAHLDDAELVRQIQDRLLCENQGFIVAMVQKAEARKKVSSDGMQDGYMAFLEALRRYKPEKGNPLAYIGKIIIRAVRNKKMKRSNIFGSVTLARHQTLIKKAKKALAAEGLDTGVDAVFEWIGRNCPEKKLSRRSIEKALLAGQCTSLDRPLPCREPDDDGAAALSSVTPDPKTSTPEEEVMAKEKADFIAKLPACDRDMYEVLYPRTMTHSAYCRKWKVSGGELRRRLAEVKEFFDAWDRGDRHRPEIKWGLYTPREAESNEVQAMPRRDADCPERSEPKKINPDQAI